VTGFIQGDKARGRPVGVGIDGTGALLVADDAGNTVWRVAAADGAVTPAPIATDDVSGTSSGPAQAGQPAAPAAPAQPAAPAPAQPAAPALPAPPAPAN